MKPIDVLSLYPPHEATLWSMLDSRSRARPDAEFIHFRGRAHSYREVANAVARAAAMYHQRGIRPGDRVGVMSRNHLSTIVTYFALARLGAIICPINPDFGREEAFYVLNHAGVSGVLCSPATAAIVSEAAGRIDKAPWILLNEGSDAGHPQFDAAMALANPAPPSPVGDGDSTCVIVYTSGTTGLPKGVMHSQRAVILSGEGFVERMRLQPEDRLLCVLPMFHINALFYSLGGALAAGATLILQESFSASTFWKTVEESKATEVNFVAAISTILCKRPREEFVPGHQLVKACVSPLAPETYRIFKEDFGVPRLLDSYGMTEIPGATITPYDGPQKLGSMGKPCKHPDASMTFTEMRVIDEEGRDAPTGTAGEFVARTPTLMQGYYRDPEQTRAAFRDGWFATGDLGYRDEDGYFWFVARKKDIIRKRGENISGAELDRVIGSHPNVLEAAAIAVPDALGEDEILVVVVPRKGETVTEIEIADWCRERLAKIKVPRYVVFAEELPHTATHRVAKHRLKEDKELLARAVDLLPP